MPVESEVVVLISFFILLKKNCMILNRYLIILGCGVPVEPEVMVGNGLCLEMHLLHRYTSLSW